MKLKNPFEVIAKLDRVHKKQMGAFIMLVFAILIPLAIEGFANVNADFSSFLNNDRESADANQILKDEFPGNEDSSLVIILQLKEDSDLESVYSPEIVEFMDELADDLETNPDIETDFELNSWTSLEESAQELYQYTMQQIPALLNESLSPLIGDLIANITYMKQMLGDISKLALSLEELSLLLDAYSVMYYDVARSVFYLSNLTNAYTEYFYASDYSLLEPYWDNTTGEMNKLITLQSYLSTFDTIDPLVTPDFIMDSVVNGIVFQLINQAILSNVPIESIPAVSQLMLSLNSSWYQAFNQEVAEGGSLYSVLEGDPNPSFIAKLTQQFMLGRLVNISKDALYTLMVNIATDEELTTALEELQGLSLSSDVNINDSLIYDLHNAPLEFMGLWFDFSRAIFYLSNFTDAYLQPTINSTHIDIINNTWAGIPFLPYNQNVTITSLAYSLTNDTDLGIYMATNPNDGDAILNNIIFQIFNGSTFLQWVLDGNLPQDYPLSLEYQSLLVLNQTWTETWLDHLIADGSLFGDYVGSPFNAGNNPGNIIEYSQLSVLNQLNDIANTTFKDFVTTLMGSIDFDSGNTTTTATFGLTIQDVAELEEFTLNLTSTLMISYISEFPINQSILQTLMATQIIPVAVAYRDIGIPDLVLKPIIVGMLNVFISELLLSGDDAVELFSIDTQGYSLDEEQLNITRLIEVIDFTYTLNALYDTTTIDGNITVAEIVANVTTNLSLELHVMFPEPTIEDIPASITSSLISGDNQTTLIVMSFPLVIENGIEVSHMENVKYVREDLQKLITEQNLEDDVEVWVSGSLATLYDDAHSIGEDLEKIDVVAPILVIFLLSIVFMSIIAPIVPLVSIGMALFSAIGMIWIISAAVNQEIPSIMLAILSVSMLGAGVDYCLFILWRYKEEREYGRNKYAAVREATIHAGESVVSSGSTVMIGFGSLLISNFALLNQLGLGPMIGIGFSLLVALTIIPIMLNIFGDKLFFPNNYRKDYLKNREKIQKEILEEKARKNNGIAKESKNKDEKKKFRLSMKGLSHWAVKNPWPVLIAFVFVTGFFLIKAGEYEASYDSSDLLPQNVESVKGLEALEGSFPIGQLYPVDMVIQFSEPLCQSTDSFYNITRLQQIEVLITDLESEFQASSFIASIETVTRPNGVPINLTDVGSLDLITLSLMKQFVSPVSNSTIHLKIILDVEPIGTEALQFIEDLRIWRDNVAETNIAGFGREDATILVGGTAAIFKEMSEIINEDTPIIMAVVLIGIFIVLYLITGSVFTPIRLELTILMTVIITLGSVQLFFVDFLNRGIPWIMPIMLFVIVFGLGMDYDIFIVTRMREEVALRGLTDEEAIIEALDKTGTIITAAGVIMACSFGSLFIADSNILQIFGFSLFLAILLDATLVRQALVPSIMVIAQRANWWNPIKALQRVPSKEEREKIRMKQLEILEKEHFFDDLSDEELKKYEKEIKSVLKNLKSLNKEKETMETQKLQEKIGTIKSTFEKFPENVQKTFEYEMKTIESKIESLSS